ncbi:MAG TPA: PGDYG domain-containing protein [Burkholderiales bacterium]|jgi:hypothetical protein|nr:PGDYG domain-containing protein [Burkholderiales bacterium]
MLELRDIDLTRDPTAALHLKDELVQVAFAASAGSLISLEGPNHYAAGDAIISGATGERWSVSRERFDAKYVAQAPTLAGSDGAYRARPVPVLARQMHEPFTLARSAGGDVLEGGPGDWVLQYAPGDYGVVAQARFARVYRPR